MKLTVYSSTGANTGSFDLPSDIFEVAWKPALVKQVIVSILANMRKPVAHTKGRGEVSGGGRKPWKQKGLGRARHGSIRSPIWVGGGVAHGPTKYKVFAKKINKKMKKAALKSVLSRKLSDNEILLLDSISFDEPKTKEAKNVLLSLSKLEGFEKILTKKRNSALILLPEFDTNVFKSFANFSNLETKEVKDLNVYDVARYKYLIFVSPEQSIKLLEERLSK